MTHKQRYLRLIDDIFTEMRRVRSYLTDEAIFFEIENFHKPSEARGNMFNPSYLYREWNKAISEYKRARKELSEFNQN